MKFYLARLRRDYPCGNKKFLDYYLKHSSLSEARKKVQGRYPSWRLLSVRIVGRVRPTCQSEP